MKQKSAPLDLNPRVLRLGSPRSKPPGHFYDICRWLWLGVFGFPMRVNYNLPESIAP